MWAPCVIAVAILGCQNREPVSLLESCIGLAVENIRQAGGTTNVRCNLTVDSVLVAVPDTATNVDSATRIGLSSRAAQAVESSDVGAFEAV